MFGGYKIPFPTGGFPEMKEFSKGTNNHPWPTTKWKAFSSIITAVQQELFLEEAIIGCYFIEERKDNKEKEMQKVVQIKIEILILCWH